MKNLLGKIWEKFNLSVLGSVNILFTFSMSFLWWRFSPDYLVSIWVLWLVIIFFYLVCIIIYSMCSAKNEVVLFELPRVKGISPVIRGHSLSEIKFIMESNSLFEYESCMILKYYDEDSNTEIKLGIGCVEDIYATNGNMQVRFIELSEDEQARKIIASLKNTKHHVNAIRIKPLIQKGGY